jgi:hypothetical protein
VVRRISSRSCLHSATAIGVSFARCISHSTAQNTCLCAVEASAAAAAAAVVRCNCVELLLAMPGGGQYRVPMIYIARAIACTLVLFLRCAQYYYYHCSSALLLLLHTEETRARKLQRYEAIAAHCAAIQ